MRSLVCRVELTMQILTGFRLTSVTGSIRGIVHCERALLRPALRQADRQAGGVFRRLDHAGKLHRVGGNRLGKKIIPGGAAGVGLRRLPAIPEDAGDETVAGMLQAAMVRLR